MQRHSFTHNNLNFSYLDSGGDGEILIALHAHFMQGKTFSQLADELSPQWRVVALDQRGHGYTDHARSYTRKDYLDDISAFLKHLNIKEPVVIMGNSLGGVNAYQFAAQNPELIRAMIIEDIGVELSIDLSFSLAWKGIFKTKDEFSQCIGPRFISYLQDSLYKTDKGWTLMFNPEEMIISNSFTNGNHWNDWLKTDCPCLLIRGQNSRVLVQEHAEQMVSRRPNTNLQVLDGGHAVHRDNPIGFTNALKSFLRTL